MRSRRRWTRRRRRKRRREFRYLPEDETKLVTSYVTSRSWALLSPLFNRCRKPKILLRALFSEQAPRHQNCTSLLQQLHWLPISVRIKCDNTCMWYNAITGSAHSYLFEQLHLYSSSRPLRPSLDKRILKLLRFNCRTNGFRVLSHIGPSIWDYLTRTSKTLLLSLFSKANSRHFSFSNISVNQRGHSSISLSLSWTFVDVLVVW